MSVVAAAAVSALVGLLVTPWMHGRIARSPMHLRRSGAPAHCSTCGSTVAAGQRIPVVAWLSHNNRCRVCASVLWRDAPRLEIITVALLALVGWQLHFAWALPAFLLFFVVAIIITLVDLRNYVIPTKIVYPATLGGIALLGVAAGVDGLWDRYLIALAAMIGTWLFFFVFWFFFPAGIGFGDVRLALLIGLFTGWLGVTNTVLGVFLGLLVGALVGVFLVVVRLKTMKTAVPYGPFMITGAAIAILFPQGFASLVQLFIGA